MSEQSPGLDGNEREQQPRVPGRRALIKGGLATIPVMLTLRGRPAYATGGGSSLGGYNDYNPGHGSDLEDPYDDPGLGSSGSSSDLSR